VKKAFDTAMTTGFVYDPVFLDHDTGPGHPERRERLVATMDFLEQQPWFARLKRITPQPAERNWIQQIHAERYIVRAEQTCRAGAHYFDVADVGISPSSYEVALLAVGGALSLADQLMAGEINNGFALVRPPGHHAEKDLALGFCMFNNVAILARYLQQQHGLEKVLILDWDVHHGNGTQHTFEEDPSVLYVSAHQYPCYPGTGAVSETGIGRGTGATLNCPMWAGADDHDYEQAFMERILPKIEDFKPQAVIISAGFDAHIDDPLAQVRLSTEFFGWMTERMLEIADKHANGRIVSVLEGGYNLRMLPRCVGQHLSVLSAAP
jgi:acetoin utilization deacetylase AcuC-like enzyme